MRARADTQLRALREDIAWMLLEVAADCAADDQPSAAAAPAPPNPTTPRHPAASAAAAATPRTPAAAAVGSSGGGYRCPPRLLASLQRWNAALSKAVLLAPAGGGAPAPAHAAGSAPPGG